MKASGALLASALVSGLLFAFAGKTSMAQAKSVRSTYHAAVKIVAGQHRRSGQSSREGGTRVR